MARCVAALMAETMNLDARAAKEFEVRYSNQGRWGEDPPNALHFITPDRVRVACGLPRRGWPIPCTLPMGVQTPPNLVPRISATRPSPNGIAGRGVLLDLARAEGVAQLPGGVAIAPDRLDACAEGQGVTVEAGDILLIRTGSLSHCCAMGCWEDYLWGPAPGLSFACVRWLYEREVALVAADTASVEVRPSEVSGMERPLRKVSLEHTGVLFGENFHLDALAEACAADGDYAFLFAAPPLPDTDACIARPLTIK
jgi:kynurenine formamidase